MIYTQAFDDLLLGTKFIYFRHIKGIRNWLDAPTAIAEYIQPRIDQNDSIYVVDDEPIIYFLTRAKMPTKYVFPPFLVLRVDLPNITGVEPAKELDSIMSKRPIYVIKRQSEANPYYVESNRFFFERVNSFLGQDYQLETTIAGVNLYRRR